VVGLPLRSADEEQFDAVAATWAERYRNVPSFGMRLRLVTTTLTRELRGRPPARILDIGSGPGVLGMAVSSLASLVVCVDRSMPMAIEGKRSSESISIMLDSANIPHNPSVVVRVAGSHAAVAGGAGRFDVVMMISVLEYQADPKKMLADVVHLLRPGGLLLLTVPNQRSMLRRIERPLDYCSVAVGRLISVPRLANRCYSGTRPYGSKVPWVEALSSAGAFVTQQQGIRLGDRPPRSWIRPNVLVVARVP
jgi:SAM-dependent methyltransferase